MHSLELSLQVFIDLEGFAHIFVNHELVGDSKWDKEAGSVGFTMQVRKSCQHPEEDVVERFLVSMDNFTAEIGVEISRVPKDFKEAANTFFCLILSLFLHIDSLVGLIQVFEDLVDKFKELKWRFVIKFHH